MTAYIIGGIAVAVLIVTQLYTILAAGNREFDLEDVEQELFIKEWRRKHAK
jgi:hypothetical protein